MTAVAELGTQLDLERAEAIQHLLRHPLLDVSDDRPAYTLVARHEPWLVTWFDDTCGWALHVDPAAGFARLDKRQAQPDATRPLRRRRGSRAPFDRRRYQLLCLVAAELVSHPVTTVGLLAQAGASSGELSTDKHGERVAFVDALLVLRAWRAVQVTSGDIEEFAANESANALLVADLSRLHRLIVAATAPSKIAAGAEDPVGPGGGTDAPAPDPLINTAAPLGAGFEGHVAALLAEPRYGPPGTVDDADPHRWTRHHLARRLLDDPVLHLADCSDDELAYLASGAGRTWLRTRVAEAGLVLEERVDGLLAVDRSTRSTDDTFPGPNGTAHQMALLLVDRLVDEVPGDGEQEAVRRPRTRTDVELRAATAERLAAHPAWAKAYQDGDGAARLAAEAVALLAAFDLVRVGAGTVEARPALCRYRPAVASSPPSPLGNEPTLFDVAAELDPAPVAATPPRSP